MSFQVCGYCGGEVAGANGSFNHKSNCPGLVQGYGWSPGATRIFVTPHRFDDRVTIAKLRRKLHCIATDYKLLGLIEDECIEAALRLVEETDENLHPLAEQTP